jgi:hypothetical protein
MEEIGNYGEGSLGVDKEMKIKARFTDKGQSASGAGT